MYARVSSILDLGAKTRCPIYITVVMETTWTPRGALLLQVWFSLHFTLIFVRLSFTNIYSLGKRLSVWPKNGYNVPFVNDF